MAEAHDLVLRSDRFIEIALDAIFAADFFEHQKHIFIGPAMQGTGQGADG